MFHSSQVSTAATLFVIAFIIIFPLDFLAAPSQRIVVGQNTFQTRGWPWTTTTAILLTKEREEQTDKLGRQREKRGRLPARVPFCAHLYKSLCRRWRCLRSLLLCGLQSESVHKSVFFAHRFGHCERRFNRLAAAPRAQQRVRLQHTRTSGRPASRRRRLGRANQESEAHAPIARTRPAECSEFFELKNSSRHCQLRSAWGK